MRFIRLASVAAVVLAASIASANAANLIENGGFEKPAAPAGGLKRLSVGAKIAPWKIVGAGGTVDLISTEFSQGGYDFIAKSGDQFLDLTGDSNSPIGVEQVITTKRGKLYSVTLFVGSVYNPGGIFGTQSAVRVLVDGEEIATFVQTAKAGPSVQQWRKFSTEFTATKTKTRVTLLNADASNDTDNGVDKVSVEEVPEP